MANLGTELIYSFVIIICSLMIYFGTKELYELSQHKGIKYFRLAFLFFALAYFSRSFIKFFIIYFNAGNILEISPRILAPAITQITLMIFMYFSSMAIFYLLSSVIYKKWKINSKKIILFHLVSIMIALCSIFSASPFTYLILNIFLFAFILTTVLVSYKSKRKNKTHKLYFVYTLLLFFWILNIIDILTPIFLQIYQIMIYLASSGIFLIMLYKVLKKVGN